MNKIASLYAALKYFDQNSTLNAYLIFVKIPPCTLIRACTLIQNTRVNSYRPFFQRFVGRYLFQFARATAYMCLFICYSIFSWHALHLKLD